MNGISSTSISSIVCSAVLGLMAGIGHGFVSHHNNLPFSLTDQIIQPLNSSAIIDR